MAEKKRTAGEQVAIATNTAGAIAGPAAIYQAVSGRKEGGLPRQLARASVQRTKTDVLDTVKRGGKKTQVLRQVTTPTKFGTTRAGRAVTRGVRALDNPGTNKKFRVASGIAGGTMVGLQGANWAGDTIAARLLTNKEKKVTKSYDGTGTARVSETVDRRGTGIGESLVSKKGGYQSASEYRDDRIRRSGRGEAYGYGGATAAGLGGGAGAIYSAKGSGAWGAAKQYRKNLKASKWRKGALGGGLAAIAASPALVYGTKRLSRESQEDWT